MKLQKVAFLDRDGVINRDSPHYIKNWGEYEFLPGSLEALKRLNQLGIHVIVITNQSIINRGMVPAQVLAHTHARLREAVRQAGGLIHDIFFCPHRPDENCSCRKPKPGLIRQAAQRHAIDPGATVMVGDSAKDILCGHAAGCRATILVRTGNFELAEKALASQAVQPNATPHDLLRAVPVIAACLEGE
ncbi:MAG: D-glycero-beta-D-manno-heptose 1,7-bisphosphate 7-phosphatase [Desulfatitalea sp.]|nr:D-glycero-beta-D-manno-heptose 1,7-bisphosphate 7-phosphatase [Desulfatitalea sp.]NNJ98843.1 D-glycero-beta-D-manno-heptose 1,7-bisphosphate 7-phosphatase [Desulfatitalea sp.]